MIISKMETITNPRDPGRELSKAQAAVLNQLAEPGRILHAVRSGVQQTLFWNHTASRTHAVAAPVHHDTVRILLDAGMIRDREAEEWRWRGSKYVITPKGKRWVTIQKSATRARMD